MKVTSTAIETAKSAKETFIRVNEAIEAATKRLAELTNNPDKTARVLTAIEVIQQALKTADNAHRICRRIAVQALSVHSESLVELTDAELAALAYGLDPKDTL